MAPFNAITFALQARLEPRWILAGAVVVVVLWILARNFNKRKW